MAQKSCYDTVNIGIDVLFILRIKDSLIVYNILSNILPFLIFLFLFIYILIFGKIFMLRRKTIKLFDCFFFTAIND